ncbi:MAG: methyltransferase domain-containing protein [Chloroflexota bacterium]
MFDWHKRFIQQAGWTAQIRAHLFAKIKFKPAQRILEVGCGSGAVLATLPSACQRYGLDINLDFLSIAHREAPGAALTGGNAYHLPFMPASMDHCVCHFFLLWVQPERALAEMLRVTRSGGAVIALAEPDYLARIDYPQELAHLGRMQAEALLKNGADPSAGRKLRHWFNLAGLINVESGVLGGQWINQPSAADQESEWAVIRTDLEGKVAPAELSRLQEMDRRAWKLGSRILYVPTFYALGFVP